MSTRHDGRKPNELRDFSLERGYASAAPGSVLVQAGRTMVLCTASVASGVPPWMAGKGKGWVTAEYGMLPGSTSPRKPRERQKVDGRTTEIQRLIGRSLRAVIDLEALGERSVTVDCDVLRADGGTRTASITGAYVALVDAVRSLSSELDSWESVFRDSIAAVSAGIVQGQPVLDLDYREDFAAEVDMNVVMTGAGRFVEVQGTGEEATFTAEQLQSMLGLATQGVERLTRIQQQTLSTDWPVERSPR